MKIRALIALLMITSSISVYADCQHNNQSYPTGTVMNGLVCTADGSWKPAS